MATNELPSSLPALPDVEQLSDRVWRIMGLNPSNFCLQGTNTYLIGLGDRKILLDVGEGDPAYLQLLQQCLKDISPTAYISDILISHCHHDHWRSLSPIMHSALNSPSRPIRVHKYPLPHDSEDHGNHMIDFPQDIPISPLHDQQTFHLDDGATTLRTMYTPGHADDHCCFWLEQSNTLLSADCVVGHGWVVVSDMKTYMASLETLATLPSSLRLYPGHGAVVEKGLDRIKEYLAHLLNKEAMIIKALQAPPPAGNAGWSPWSLTFELPGLNVKPHTEHLVSFTIMLHLLKLGKEGKARIVDGSDFDPKNMYAMMDKEWCYVDKSRL